MVLLGIFACEQASPGLSTGFLKIYLIILYFVDSSTQKSEH